MKLKCFVSLLLTVQAVSSAQLVRNAGAKIGVVASTWKYYEPGLPIDIEYRLGGDFGAFVEWFNAPVLSLLTEIHFIQKGAKFVNNTSLEFGVFSPRRKYLSFPILIKARLPDQKLSPYILGGPRVDFLIEVNDLDPEFGWNHSRRTNVGMMIGIGVEAAELNVGISNAGAEIRYDQDLRDAYFSARSSSFQFLVFVGF